MYRGTFGEETGELDAYVKIALNEQPKIGDSLKNLISVFAAGNMYTLSILYFYFSTSYFKKSYRIMPGMRTDHPLCLLIYPMSFYFNALRYCFIQFKIMFFYLYQTFAKFTLKKKAS